MLILTRRIGETLMIGDDVALQILSVNGNQVKIGIEADKKVPIHRLEVWRKIQDENKPFNR